MKKTATKLVALVASALLLLTGCSTNNPNVAATVGNQQISVAQVDAFAHQLATAVAKISEGSGQAAPAWGELRSPALQILIQIELVRVANLDAKVTVTDAQRKAAAASNQIYSALAQDPSASQVLSEWLDAVVIANDSKGNASLMKLAKGTPIELNPVFGTWDQTQFKLTGDTGSLSKVLPSAS